MADWFLNTMCWLVLVTVSVLAGCEQKYQDKEDTTAYGPDIEKIVVTNSYTPRSIGATGGYQAWIKATQFQFDAVVAFYQPDGSFYLTEQHYEIYPWSNSIRISALEPQGELVWELSRGGAKGGESWHTGIGFPIELCSKHYFTELILDITTAPVRFLDSKVKFTERPRPVKIEGQWYHSIKRVNPDETGIWSEAVFYQNTDSSLVDMLWFTDVDENKSFMVRGYDYHEVGKAGVRVPTKIEIFRTNAAGVLKQRLVKIDLK